MRTPPAPLPGGHLESDGAAASVRSRVGRSWNTAWPAAPVHRHHKWSHEAHQLRYSLDGPCNADFTVLTGSMVTRHADPGPHFRNEAVS